MVTEGKQSGCSRSRHLESKSWCPQHQEGHRRSWVFKVCRSRAEWRAHGQDKMKRNDMKLGRNRVKRMVQRERKVIGRCDNWVCCVLSRFSHVQLFATLWIVAQQAPLSVGFSRQEYWSGLPFPTPRDLPHPGIKPASLASPALAGKIFTPCAIWEALSNLCQLGIRDKEMILRAGEARCIAWRVDGMEGAGLSSSHGVHASLKKHNCLQTRKKKTNLVKKKLKPQRSELLQKASHF